MARTTEGTFAAETRRLKESLPAEVRETIDRHEAAGTTHDHAYAQATMAYCARWVCRRDPFPGHVMRSFMSLREDVYGTMQGPEWNLTGNLKDWDVTARLGKLYPPVPITSDRHDEMTSTLVQPLVDGIRGAEHRSSRRVPTSPWPKSPSATDASSSRSRVARKHRGHSVARGSAMPMQGGRSWMCPIPTGDLL